MNARQKREAASFLAAGGSVETYAPADRLRPVWARLRGRPAPVLRASRTATGLVPDLAWAAAPVPPVERWSR